MARTQQDDVTNEALNTLVMVFRKRAGEKKRKKKEESKKTELTDRAMAEIAAGKQEVVNG